MTAVRQGPARWLWLAGGFLAVGIGAIGVVVPGLPTTGFFVVAASCFARSSPRFERWVLGLPGIGSMVEDYRAGLGMPRRAKVLAVAGIAVAAGLSATFALTGAARAVVVVLGLPGIGSMVEDYRAGLGMPRRAKVLAVASIAVAAGLSATFALTGAARAVVVVLGLIGVWFVGIRIPTRERVLEQRAAADAGRPSFPAIPN